ncbi:LOW QUALITY PROTEIN: uncharacterized protein LOC129764503 [Toxorhynchites rutilus septentrionalis]|uniref:LOW QUALITY PROTEIN: uncharacterized protein LOC129764503 n=1 Tax=Toxorhynchites rutilus septentrionalis TaxID=329112 RepID=UPI00247AAA86|nr:LOW QUALITY PROTEIN: uncharacterized protein LOC129764503 [Toxorhynchites rutilus septentrionalis]
MSTPIVINVPTKYIPIHLAPVKTEIKPVIFGSDDADESTSSMDEFLVRGKKRRLDHLTWEEKLQRKKLKNRVAAQTSRDRKKAKMEDMEQTVQNQAEQISELKSKCDLLQAEKEAIHSKYLDLESRFEELKRRLDEQQQNQSQQPQTTSAVTIKSEPNAEASHSVGSVSTLLGSAASAQTPQQQTLFNGNTDDTASGTGQREVGGSVEDNCSLPALQDMLEEFDVSKLEELAESLLADVTSELEGTDRGSLPTDAQDAGPGGRMLGPVVGTSSERLEPGQETDQGSSLILNTHNYSKSPFHVETPLSGENQQSGLNQQTTVFGSYDDATNCITIVLNDDEISLEEEVICEESEEEMVHEAEFEIKLEPVRELLSPIPSTCSNYSSAPSDCSRMHVDEEPQKVQKIPPSPQSFISDGGYESLSSPTYSTDFNMSALDDFWNLDLFPILS